NQAEDAPHATDEAAPCPVSAAAKPCLGSTGPYRNAYHGRNWQEQYRQYNRDGACGRPDDGVYDKWVSKLAGLLLGGQSQDRWSSHDAGQRGGCLDGCLAGGDGLYSRASHRRTVVVVELGRHQRCHRSRRYHVRLLQEHRYGQYGTQYELQAIEQ